MIIYIIGAGTMGSAIAQVLAKKRHKVYVSDVNPSRLIYLKKQVKVSIDKGLKNLSKADFVVVAVKPQDIAELAKKATGLIDGQSILVSIAAGVKIAKLHKFFGVKKVVRVMPNLGLVVDNGMAVFKTSGLSAKEIRLAKGLLDDFTANFVVKNESEIDAATAVMANGPAYFFYLARHMYDQARDFGFTDSSARLMVEKTFGAAALLQKGSDYENLIGQVRSKKGTTDAALKVFDKHQMGKIIKAGMRAGRDRAKQLSNG